MILATLLLCASPIATDGDSIRCANGTRLRLSMADAPDSTRSPRCNPPRPGAWCDDAAAARAKANLARLVRGQTVTYRQVDANPCRAGFQVDPYARRGRVVARVYAGGLDLGTEQLRSGNARVWRCE